MNLENRNERRRRKYKQLIEAGYTREEATKYKDLSNLKVIELLELREKYNVAFDREYLEFEKEKNKILGVN